MPYLLHQSSGTSAASPMTEQQASLRRINTRKRATSITAASPRQALAEPPLHDVQQCTSPLLHVLHM